MPFGRQPPHCAFNIGECAAKVGAREARQHGRDVSKVDFGHTAKEPVCLILSLLLVTPAGASRQGPLGISENSHCQNGPVSAATPHILWRSG
jgi:hypothetical protein